MLHRHLYLSTAYRIFANWLLLGTLHGLSRPFLKGLLWRQMGRKQDR
nr:MAG TPA: hypothetical protein [Caudoviricetes sp.]